MKETKLTTKQQRFVDYYEGNATEAARKAGYKGNDITLGAVGAENLKKPQIMQAIEKREEKRKKKGILTREQRQQLWSMIAIGKKPDSAPDDMKVTLNDMLKASELLAKSEADFIQKHELTGANGEAIQHEVTIKVINGSKDRD